MTTKSVEAPNGTAKRRKPAAKKQTPAAPHLRGRKLLAWQRSIGLSVAGRKVRPSRIGCARNKN